MTASPTVVSPDNTVSTGSRVITISITDPDLNRSAFIGSGPNGESPDLGSTGVGEQITFAAAGAAIGTIIFSVTYNGVNVDGSTPLADRDGDDDVDVNDVEIVNKDIVGADGLDDIDVAAIFNAQRGIITFNVFTAIPGGTSFTLRYATSSRELTRATKSFTESLAVPPTGLFANETFTRALALTLRDSNGYTFTNTGDVTAGGATSLLISTGSTTANNSLVLFSKATIGTGGAYILTYTGDHVITLTTALLRSTPATGALPTGVTLQPAVATSGDIQVVAVSAAGRVTGDIEVGPFGTGLAIIARTGDSPGQQHGYRSCGSSRGPDCPQHRPG